MSSREVYLLMGSNIQPEAHFAAALARLRAVMQVIKLSPVWESPALGSPGPNFLNMAIQVAVADVTPRQLKYSVLRKIEADLGRIRSSDKNAPRTIDLDILIYDAQVLEPALWQRAYIACPLSALLPDLFHPDSGQTLRQVAEILQKESQVHLRADLRF